jgi:hypothetical protein
MKLIIMNSLKKTTTLDVEPNTTVIDLMKMLYKESKELEEIVLYAEGLSGAATKLEIDKNLTDYKINETSILTSIPTDLLQIPDELCCPLSMQIFLNPVSLPCGTIVEREVIEKWITEHGNCPFTRQPLNLKDLNSEKNLKSNEAMQKKVSDFFTQHKNHPFIDEIKEKKQYQLQNYTAQPSHPTHGTVEMDADDLLAMANNFLLHADNYPSSFRLFSMFAVPRNVTSNESTVVSQVVTGEDSVDIIVVFDFLPRPTTRI